MGQKEQGASGTKLAGHDNLSARDSKAQQVLPVYWCAHKNTHLLLDTCNMQHAIYNRRGWDHTMCVCWG